MELNEEEVGGESGGHLGLRNSGEANIVLRVLRALLTDGFKAQDVGVIAPYSSQVCMLRELVADELPGHFFEISTVDGFQGREKEVIVFSATRSNED